MNPARLTSLALLIGALLVSGCDTTGGDSRSTQPAPALEIVGGATGGFVASVEVVSDPSDAMVVINRKPIGITPRKIELPVTEQGYLAEQVTIAVRFVARDVEEASLTESITLYRTDRVPSQLMFARGRGTVRSFR